MENKLTIYFNKRTGTIKELCSGIQDMSWFGDEAQDYELIYDFIVVDDDRFIFENIQMFHVVDGQLKIQSPTIPEQYL